MNNSPKIISVEAIPIAVTGNRPFRISEGQTTRHVSVIVRISTEEDGLSGVGEIVSAPPGKPEEILGEIVYAVENYVRPAIVGLPATSRKQAILKIAQVLKGRVWTKAGVTNALYDLQSKAIGQPVCALLGGRLRDEIPIAGPVIGINSPEAMVAEAVSQANAGYKAIKIKIGETTELDYVRVREVRNALPNSVQLRVDANDHYSLVQAKQICRLLDDMNIEHLEQPLPRGDLLGMAELRRFSRIPLMTDDSVATLEDAVNVIRLGAADRVKVKVSKHGLENAQLIIGILEAAGISCVLGHVFQLGLARLTEAHLAACATNLNPPHEMGSMKPMGITQDILKNALEVTPGIIRLPSGPGLSAELDWDLIEKLRIGVGHG